MLLFELERWDNNLFFCAIPDVRFVLTSQINFVTHSLVSNQLKFCLQGLELGQHTNHFANRSFLLFPFYQKDVTAENIKILFIVQFFNMVQLSCFKFIYADPFWELRRRMMTKICLKMRIQTKRMIFKKLPIGVRMVKVLLMWMLWSY